MNRSRPITIIGGGLAGLTLGIGLRQRDVPVTVYEAGRYPRHRVCGEFISGRGEEVLTRLGLREAIAQVGAVTAETVAFFVGRQSLPAHGLSPPALSLSRFKLDALLAREFRRLGGDLHENTRWHDDHAGDGVVRATGRRAQATQNGWRWFVLKVHARCVELSADLEMHVLDSGYVGISRLTGGEVNVCGLFRRRVHAPDAAVDRSALLWGTPGTVLHDRLAEAVFEPDSFCSVAGLCLRPQRAAGREVCCIGDALTMIAPVTGNGMSMAFEAAEFAMGPLLAYSRRECDWPEVQQQVAELCDHSFGHRLVWAQWVQSLLFSRALHCRWLTMALRSEWLWRLLFANTRM